MLPQRKSISNKYDFLANSPSAFPKQTEFRCGFFHYQVDSQAFTVIKNKTQGS